MLRAPGALVVALLAGLSHGGCARAAPERLYREAETLRTSYQESATRLAIAKYDAAASTWEKRGLPREAAMAAQQAASSLEQLGRLHESARSYEHALTLSVASADQLLESEIRSHLGTVKSFLADGDQRFAEAGQECEKALSLARQHGGQRQVARALDCLGDVAYYQQRTVDALGPYLEASRMLEGLGDARAQARNLLLLADAYSDLSRFDEARTCHARARLLWLAAPEPRDEALATVAEARIDFRRGHYQSAIDKFNQALDRLRPMGDALYEGSSLAGLAVINYKLGENHSAVQYWERALTLFDAAGLKNIAVDGRISLGEVYLASGDDGQALRRFEQALGLARELGIKRWEAVALRYLGAVNIARRAPDVAERYLEDSLAIQRSLGDSGEERLQAQTRTDLAEARTLAGRYDQAIEDFNAALPLSKTAVDRVTEARALYGLAKVSFIRRDLAGALPRVEAALAAVESLRQEVNSPDVRASYVASVYRWYELHIDVLMRLSRTRRGPDLTIAAFEASERARARSLFESLTDARRPQASSDARRQPPRPLGLREVQRRLLDSDTLLLEYSLGEERSYLWAITTSGHRSYELPPRASIEAVARTVYERITAPLSASREPQARRRQLDASEAEFRRESRRLSEIVLGPVRDELRHKRLLIVADGTLQQVPFAALPLPGDGSEDRTIIDDHEVVTLPSASVLGVLRQASSTPATRSVAVLADPVFAADDPRLPQATAATRDRSERAGGSAADAFLALRSAGVGRGGGSDIPRLVATRDEAEAITRLAPEGTSFKALDFNASRATALSPALAGYRIVHFATHGVLNNEEPDLSGIILSLFDSSGRPQDGFLRLRDIYGLTLPVDLVVMSACSTALGKPVRGEGLVGMVRGFIHAGARRIVASYWKVDDEATGELMRRFYTAMLERGRRPAEALREAQLELRRIERWRSPFFWAAFALQGEWQ